MLDFKTDGMLEAGVVSTSALASYALGFAVHAWLMRAGVLDRPNERSSHVTPIPRGGGLGIMSAIWATGAVWGFRRHDPVLISAALMSGLLAMISFIDDRRSLPWHLRLGVQAVAACVCVAVLCATSDAANRTLVSLASPVLIFWISAYANAFNFMDGINGIAAGQAVFAGMGTAAIGCLACFSPSHPAVLLSLTIAGAAGGFLPHNFPRARMFMGDVGSVPLGFLLAVIPVWMAAERGWWLIVPLASLHANFVLDTGITILRRWRRGEPLQQAHREHFYQRLVRAGWSHTQVTCTQAGLQFVVLIAAFVGVLNGPRAAFALLPIVIGIWLLFFAMSERVFRRHALRAQALL